MCGGIKHNVAPVFLSELKNLGVWNGNKRRLGFTSIGRNRAVFAFKHSVDTHINNVETRLASAVIARMSGTGLGSI
jgi:hypothetical protein